MQPYDWLVGTVTWLLFFTVIQFLHDYSVPFSLHGTLTLPIGLRRRLKLDKYSILLVEERTDGIFLHPAMTVPVRDIPKSTIKKWIKDDEADAASVTVLKH